jgi:hypothetical protein
VDVSTEVRGLVCGSDEMTSQYVSRSTDPLVMQDLEDEDVDASICFTSP